MRRSFKWLFVGVPTFVIGVLAAGLFWFDWATPISSLEAVPPVQATGCGDSTSFPGKSREIAGLTKGKSGYFPKDDFSGGWNGRDAFINDWYGKHLKGMAEGSLLDESSSLEVYRLLWLRTFHHPIYVRVEKSQGGIWLRTVELSGAGGYEPGRPIRNQQIRLDQKQWCEFRSSLENASYWQMPTEDPDDIGNDGARWILEGVREGHYHLVDRWSPKEYEYYEACAYLLNLSGIDLDKLKDELY